MGDPSVSVEVRINGRFYSTRYYYTDDEDREDATQIAIDAACHAAKGKYITDDIKRMARATARVVYHDGDDR